MRVGVRGIPALYFYPPNRTPPPFQHCTSPLFPITTSPFTHRIPLLFPIETSSISTPHAPLFHTVHGSKSHRPSLISAPQAPLFRTLHGDKLHRPSPISAPHAPLFHTPPRGGVRATYQGYYFVCIL